jgi:hypothetical protein
VDARCGSFIACVVFNSEALKADPVAYQRLLNLIEVLNDQKFGAAVPRGKSHEAKGDMHGLGLRVAYSTPNDLGQYVLSGVRERETKEVYPTIVDFLMNDTLPKHMSLFPGPFAEMIAVSQDPESCLSQLPKIANAYCTVFFSENYRAEIHKDKDQTKALDCWIGSRLHQPNDVVAQFLMPSYGLCFNVRPSTLCLFDSKVWHGTADFEPEDDAPLLSSSR